MLPLALGIGAGAGLLKHELGREQREKDRKLDAETAMYSPWTGMKAKNMGADPSAFDSALQGGMAGASFGQGMESADAANQLQMAQADAYKRGAAPVR